MSGVVDSYQYDNGEKVSQGVKLLTLSSKDYALNVELARFELSVSRSELEAQEKQLNRLQSLFNNKGISASDLDNQLRLTNIGRAQFNVNQTKYEIAERTLDKSSPNAPFSGFIINRAIELGQFVSVGDALYTIVDMSKLKARFHLLERDFKKLSHGDKIKVVIPSSETSVTGAVTLLSPAIQENEPGFLVEVTIPNDPAALKPGMESYVYLDEENMQ